MTRDLLECVSGAEGCCEICRVSVISPRKPLTEQLLKMSAAKAGRNRGLLLGRICVFSNVCVCVGVFVR